MAIYHFRQTVISGGAGHSAVAAAAYRHNCRHALRSLPHDRGLFPPARDGAFGDRHSRRCSRMGPTEPRLPPRSPMVTAVACRARRPSTPRKSCGIRSSLARSGTTRSTPTRSRWRSAGRADTGSERRAGPRICGGAVHVEGPVADWAYTCRRGASTIRMSTSCPPCARSPSRASARRPRSRANADGDPIRTQRGDVVYENGRARRTISTRCAPLGPPR